MVYLIAGASHTGKTVLAQKLLEKLKIPYLSEDHLKMGLIRSNYTRLTPEDDDKLTDYLWPIVREIIRTAVENRQNLIVEGCYFPFDWRRNIGNREYLEHISFVCLVMTDRYINNHFCEIISHSSDIESRLDDSYCTAEYLIAENRKAEKGFTESGEKILLIDNDYESSIDSFLSEWGNNNEI